MGNAMRMGMGNWGPGKDKAGPFGDWGRLGTKDGPWRWRWRCISPAAIAVAACF